MKYRDRQTDKDRLTHRQTERHIKRHNLLEMLNNISDNANNSFNKVIENNGIIKVIKTNVIPRSKIKTHSPVTARESQNQIQNNRNKSLIYWRYSSFYALLPNDHYKHSPSFLTVHASKVLNNVSVGIITIDTNTSPGEKINTRDILIQYSALPSGALASVSIIEKVVSVHP